MSTTAEKIIQLENIKNAQKEYLQNNNCNPGNKWNEYLSMFDDIANRSTEEFETIVDEILGEQL